jgi:outer membrane protein assembly factor BamB
VALASTRSRAATSIGPVAHDGELVFSAGVGKLFAFGEHSGTSCSPRWYGEVGGYLEGTPVGAGDVVAIDGAKSIVAFPWGCRSDGAHAQRRGGSTHRW